MKPRATVLLRTDPLYRSDGFKAGLESLGFEITADANRPRPGDLLLIWNRYGIGHQAAQRFEQVGATVVVAENGYLGRDWNGRVWYALALNGHNGFGTWHVGNNERAVRLFSNHLDPWRTGGDHIVVLGTRGIGVPPVAEPHGWHRQVADRLKQQGIPVVVRGHPGKFQDNAGLHEQLNGARAAITWGSTAGIKAILAGVPVFHGFREWVAADAAKTWQQRLEFPFTGTRWPMLQKLAWAFWTIDEIATGTAFSHLLRRQP